MRHGVKDNHLSRTYGHRQALLSNMASSLIIHKRIETTVAKAKELRKYVEPLITKSKDDTTHSRRVVFSYLQNKESVKELFDNVAEKIAARPGGYTRIIKTGDRLGDKAEMCIMELVDYNLLYTGSEAKQNKSAKTRRSRKPSNAPKVEAQSTDNTISSSAVVAETVVAEPTPIVESKVTDAVPTASEVVAEVADTEVADGTVAEDNKVEDTAATDTNEDAPKA
ncbi:MAG: 50S ribosomal protein L17 [Cytophagales bacterium]|nr:50S ribosomal protein L17 [Cytophagales bacterium]